MDWINTCYWKLPYLCGLETDQCRCGKTICTQLQFQRINFRLNYNKSFPVQSTLFIHALDSSVLELRGHGNKQYKMTCHIHAGVFTSSEVSPLSEFLKETMHHISNHEYFSTAFMPSNVLKLCRKNHRQHILKIHMNV